MSASDAEAPGTATAERTLRAGEQTGGPEPGGDAIRIRGAREHNLKDVDVEIPRNRLTVVTGISGSGKSSLAFDTLYAEGQRRYVESLSAYARQFLGVMEKPDVDQIDGLSPSIAIQQRTTSRNPRSTVGTVTEIYDFLRLLWARVGTPHCPRCGKPVQRQTVGQIVDSVLSWPQGARIEVMAPLVRGRKGEFKDLFDEARQEGFVRARVDGDLVELDDPPSLDRNLNHDISVVVDRLTVNEGARDRLADSVQTALRMTGGTAQVDLHRNGGSPEGAALQEAAREGGSAGDDASDGSSPESHLFSEQYACPDCDVNIPELEPRQFSFNSPYGACPECDGLGVRREPDPEKMVGGDRISILEGVILPWGPPTKKLRQEVLPPLAEKYGFGPNDPWGTLSPEAREAVLHGDADLGWEGAVAHTRRRHHTTDSDKVRKKLEEYMTPRTCPECGGARLRAESRAVSVADRTLPEVVELPVSETRRLFAELLERVEGRSDQTAEVARPILREVTDRLDFMTQVGLGYLTLSRGAGTLAGGEAQRIRLATQIGSQLVGVLYVLDEPSIGLHQRDQRRLLSTLEDLRDLGNTVIVVEHDEETIRTADHVVDLGPGAGRQGGEVLVSGSFEELVASEESLTGAYLRGDRSIPVPEDRRATQEGDELVVRGARQHNLKDVDVAFPLGNFICVTGVSGSGKSTLVEEVLYRRLARELYDAKAPPGEHEGLEGVDRINKVIDVDQSPIGRTPRSNPATYTSVFTPIRELYAQLPEARIRGYDKGRFSFNVKGGRCEACTGDGLVKIEMHFLPDVYVPCDVCRGKRYNRETLEVLYKGKSIADVLEMTVDEALEFFDAVPRVRRKLETLSDVGLGYIRLGQPATTLSGGEAQRVKLSSELAKKATGDTVYILDEPTTGLHFEDIRILLEVLHRLVDRGNTVIVIEHQLDVIKTADWIVDLGPEGGRQGGRVVAAGTPEEVAEAEESHTGRYLADML